MSDMDNSMENREKERDRRGRSGRGSRFSDADTPNNGSVNRDRSRERRNCRVYISNIPYDYRWQDLKDLFRRIVGSVEYVELFHDENGKARGCGIVEFKDPDNVDKALEKMNRYEINGRELVVKEDHGEQRDQYGRIIRDGGGGGGGRNSMTGGGGGGGGGGGSSISGDRGERNYSRRDDDRLSGRNNFNMMGNNDYNNPPSNYNYYGLSASFLESLGITGPLHNKVFVANLDYKVDSKKLKQVFKLAGKVQSVDLSLDKDGNSRGFAVVEYDHPVEAVQAISMLDRQMLFDRRMTVRLDRIPDKGESVKLPEGLAGVGIGLGPNGEPLKDVARNLPNIIQHQQGQQQTSQMVGAGGGNGGLGGGGSMMSGNMSSNMGGTMGGGGNLGGGMFGNSNVGVQPLPVAPVVSSNKSSSSMGNLTPGSGLNLNNLNPSNLAALTNVLNNPLLTSSLGNLGLSLGQNQGSMQSANDDSNAGLSNNYTTGPANNYSSSFSSTPGFSSGGPINNPGSGAPSFSSYNSTGGGGGGGGGSGGGSGGVGSVGNSSSSAGINVGGGGSTTNTTSMDSKDFSQGGPLDLYGSGGVNTGGGNVASNVRKSDTIIIKNIPLSCTWQTLRDKFRDVGEVKFAEIRGNDVGVVRFFKERDAELAIALMDGSRMDGRTIKVTYF